MFLDSTIGDLSLAGDYLRLNHSGSAFTDSDASIYFASDASIFWDESADILVFSKDIAINNNLLRFNHDGSSFSNADAYIYFASDASIFWDESENYFYFNKIVRSSWYTYTNFGRRVTKHWAYGTSRTQAQVYTELNSTVPSDVYIIASGTIENADGLFRITAMKKNTGGTNTIEFYGYDEVAAGNSRRDAVTGSATIFSTDITVAY